MKNPLFFNTPKSHDRVHVTPLFTNAPKTFTTRDNDSGCFRGTTPAPVFFSYDHQYNPRFQDDLRGNPLFKFAYANNGAFSPFRNFNEFGNRVFNIIALPVAGLQLVAHHLVDALHATINLNFDESLFHVIASALAAVMSVALTVWELLATTSRIGATGAHLMACGLFGNHDGNTIGRTAKDVINLSPSNSTNCLLMEDQDEHDFDEESSAHLQRK